MEVEPEQLARNMEHLSLRVEVVELKMQAYADRLGLLMNENSRLKDVLHETVRWLESVLLTTDDGREADSIREGAGKLRERIRVSDLDQDR